MEKPFFDYLNHCARCGVRFSTSKRKSRKRCFSVNSEILVWLNKERVIDGRPLISHENNICHSCFIDLEYQIKKNSLDSTSSSGDAESESGSLINQRCGSQMSLGGENDLTLDEETTFSDATQNDDEHVTGPSRPHQSYCCSNCGRDLKRNRKGRVRKLETNIDLLKYVNQVRKADNKSPIQLGSWMCNSCYMPYMSAYLGNKDEGNQEPASGQSEDQDMEASPTSNSTTETSSSSENSEGEASETNQGYPDQSEILLPIRSPYKPHRGCFICKKSRGNTRIDKQARIQLWIDHEIFLQEGLRICKTHIEKESRQFEKESLKWILDLPLRNATSLNVKEVTDFLRGLTLYSDTNYKRGRLFFSGKVMYSEDDYIQFFGIKKAQFIELHGLVEPYLRNTKTRCSEDALAMFLFKLRNNASHKLLGALFNLSISSVGRAIRTVRKKLVHIFVPKHLGYTHLPRNEFINDHTTEIAKQLTGASELQCIVVVDGTYLYIQKSSNYKTQRRTYSAHKYRNLLKAMMLVSTTGHILHAEGPYLADGGNNDANIMKNMSRDLDGFRQYFKAGDFIIEDRGFRDCNELLTSLGYSVKMPHFLGGKRKQHTTFEANESRLVTKIRWVVESVNGRIKNVFRFFRDVIQNTYLKNNAIWDFFKIAFAMLNAFHPPLKLDAPEDLEFAKIMTQRLHMENLLQQRLEEANLIRKTKEWKKVGIDTVPDFPVLTIKDLRRLTLGIYQLKQAPSYLGENENDDGDYDLFWHEELGTSAVRFFIKSRFRGAKVHSCWIGYNTRNEGWKSITGWYCLCEVGARIIGCCAHIAAVIWYLSYARYLAKIKVPGKDLVENVRDAATFHYDTETVDIVDEEDDMFQSDDESSS